MSNEAIDKSAMVRDFTREVRNKNAAIFAGAGLSMDSGYVDWSTLLKEIIEDLKLDPLKEHDLVTLAQYHCNQSGGNKSRLTQTIINHFLKTNKPTENHKILASLPISTYWTTNYDKLIETALQDAKRTVDIKHHPDQLTTTRPNRDVTVYKMHGDAENAVNAIISKDDYESYEYKMGSFVSALRGDLIEKTFLFLGFSFTDPNIDYILSRVRVQHEKSQRQHYCILRKVPAKTGQSRDEKAYRELKQHYFIRDLKRFNILTVLVDDYSEITEILKNIQTTFRRHSILISGAVADHGEWTPKSAEYFLYKLGLELSAAGNRIVTGFGVGVGGAVINGALETLDRECKTVREEYIVMRPFPQSAPINSIQNSRWTIYREQMVSHAGIAIFVFGNKINDQGKTVPALGMQEEFDLCRKNGICPIPIGATGFLAETMWREVASNIQAFIPNSNAQFISRFKKLGDKAQKPDDLIRLTKELIAIIQRD